MRLLTRSLLLSAVCLLLGSATAEANDRRRPIRNAIGAVAEARPVRTALFGNRSCPCPQSCAPAGGPNVSVPQVMPGPAVPYYVTPANCANGQCQPVARYAR